MILGIGIDIVEVARVQASYEKFGERFLNRILLKAVSPVWQVLSRPADSVRPIPPPHSLLQPG